MKYDTYDYIIVGAGSAGCVLANRLSADPSVRVLLIEAAGADRHPFFHWPAGFAKMTRGIGSWGWQTVPQKHLGNRVLRFTQAKVIGGGSSINAQIYTRGAPQDYDDWERAGAAGWGWSSVLPYFRRSERNQRFANAFHGSDGPMGVSNPVSPLPVCEAFFRAGQEMGIPFNPDFNGDAQAGLGYYQLTQAEARRCSTAQAFIAPVRNRPNLTVALRSQALRVLVDKGRATGVVVESALDKGRGPVATVLVQQGTLKKGDYLVCGVQYGRVRAMFDENGKQVTEAGPSIPVLVLGLSGVPDAGDDFVVVEDERLAKDVAQQRDAKRRESRLVKQAGNRMEDIMAQMGEGQGQLSLNLVVKADVQGSAEALRESLSAITTDAIRVNVIASGVGGITESDATLAAASKAVIIGFNVRADASARRIIESNGLDLRYFSIIYDVIDQVKQVASGLLGVEIREEIIGIAEVRDVFRSSKFGAVAGCMVVEGTVKRNKPIRVLRASTVVFEGELESLRRFKENVDEVRNGTECGIGVKGYDQVKAGDKIECFERIEVQRTL